MPPAGPKTKMQSWRLATPHGMKKEDLVRLSGTMQGRQQLQELKGALDKCVIWCDRHLCWFTAVERCTADECGAAAEEASNAKHAEFETALEGMAHRAEELRKMGANGERLIQFTDHTAPSPLIEFIEGLPSVTPTLGYKSCHIPNLASTVRRVVAGAGKRVGEREHLARFLEHGEETVHPGLMALAREGPYEGFELFLAGILYTADLTEKVKQADGSFK
eukprot:Hpha_TRINITY_DN15105_c6_g3::TRINITY_DN15105_c6_g3_i1::g.126889::m.126889